MSLAQKKESGPQGLPEKQEQAEDFFIWAWLK